MMPLGGRQWKDKHTATSHIINKLANHPFVINTKPLLQYERPLRLSNGNILSVQCYDGKNLLINVF